MDENLEKALKVAKIMNSISSTERLSIPILDNFEIVREELPDSNLVFLAQKDNMLEQFIIDGVLEEDETFTQRISKVVEAVRTKTEKNPLYENENYIYSYRTYKNELFEFNIYVQDIIIGTRKNKKFIRQMNAYFIEPEENNFCQLSIAIGPFVLSDDQKLLKDIQDYSKNPIVSSLDIAMNSVLGAIKYNEIVDEDERMKEILKEEGYEQL